VLLDVMMPRKTGFDVCQEVRAHDREGHPDLMLTAKGRDTDVAKGLALGANAYMTKPFSTKELVRRCAACWGLRMRRQKKRPTGACGGCWAFRGGVSVLWLLGTVRLMGSTLDAQERGGAGPCWATGWCW
jgi:DNA-binding response OmpR family regulator